MAPKRNTRRRSGVVNGQPQKIKRVRLKGIRKIRLKELGPFTLRLAAMLDAGLPLVQSLNALREQCEHVVFRKVINDLRERIEAGDSFAEALTRYHDLFGDLYVSMIHAGEASGGLAEVAERLGQYLEASAALRRRVISAMTYPVIVMGMSLILTSAMIVFIVPKFGEMYADFDAKLPTATLTLVRISEVVRGNALLFVAAIVATIYAIRCFRRTPKGEYIWDRYILRTPVAGVLIRKIALARMARTFASLVRSGVSILKTFEIVAQSTGNRFLSTALLAAGHEVETGSAIAAAFTNSGVFPPMVNHMVSAGEKTGNVDGMLEKVADFYEDEVANMLESLASMIEPLLMAFLGVVIGGIVICMFLPIFKLSEIINV